MVVFGPVIGLASGVVIGLLTLLVHVILRKKLAAA
jgi:tetrahydromethanopterin S-methyltransferase subunit G